MAHTKSINGLTRREFIKFGSATSLVAATGLPFHLYGAEEEGPEVWVLQGEDKRALMQRACRIIRDNGGFGQSVDTLALKVNSAWARKPETGANTHPALVNEFINQAYDAGVNEVVVPEHPCDDPRWAFTRTGIKDAVEDAGAEMVDLKANTGHFRETQIPDGKKLQKAEVAEQFLEADMVVNMPTAKHHGGAKLTIGMKNWMGAVRDRGFFHRNNLHQCIADFTSFLKADWTINDVLTFMPDSGPKGPSDNLRTIEKLVVSKSPVAADAFTAQLCGVAPQDVPHIKNAGDMDLGVIDPDAMTVHELDVS